jgi:hypothetical protein
MGKSIRIAAGVLLLVALMALSGPALAQGSSDRPIVRPKIIHRQPPGPVIRPRTATSGQALPFTGANVLVLVTLGGSFILVGTLLVRSSRGRRAAA